MLVCKAYESCALKVWFETSVVPPSHQAFRRSVFFSSGAKGWGFLSSKQKRAWKTRLRIRKQPTYTPPKNYNMTMEKNSNNLSWCISYQKKWWFFHSCHVSFRGNSSGIFRGFIYWSSGWWVAEVRNCHTSCSSRKNRRILLIEETPANQLRLGSLTPLFARVYICQVLQDFFHQE